VSYVNVWVPPGLQGLGEVTAEQRALNRQRNEESGAASAMVGPGYWDDWLDVALTPRGISSADASRVPGAVREVLEASGAEVDKVGWGGGTSFGGPATRGKVYAKWKPGRPYNAVTYADIVRNLFASAADQFAAGSQLVMARYRVLSGGLFSDHRYVYPEGGAIPAGAPAAARRTTVDTPPLEEPAADLTIIERQMAGDSALSPGAWVAIGVGGTVALGVGYLWYQGRMKRNRRRRRRR